MKNALVTGAGGGLGQNLCREFLKRGYRVFGWNNVETPAVGELAGEYGDRFVFDIVDISTYPAVEAAAEKVSQMTDSLDVIVNAAGILLREGDKPLPELDIDGTSMVMFNINAVGPLRVMKALLPLLKAGEDKLVIQISSESGSMTTHMPNYISRYGYCMSKASLNIQSIILQRYLKDEGVRVYLFHQGWMQTAMGGEKAPLLPSQSAAGIVGLFDNGNRPDTMYMDYDGTPRAW